MSALEGTNRPGLCTRCEKPIYESILQYPVDHPYAGGMLRLGKPLEDFRIITLVLSNGHQTPFTVCKNCADIAEEGGLKMSQIWKKLLRTWALEMDDEHRINIGAVPYTPKQREIVERQFLELVARVPIGILCIHSEGEQNG